MNAQEAVSPAPQVTIDALTDPDSGEVCFMRTMESSEVIK
jgi:hypothetical protein